MRSLSLIDLDLGGNPEGGTLKTTTTQKQLIADIVLYNETLRKLDLSGNKLSRLKPLFENLVRNRNSQIQKLVLSRNDWEVREIGEMHKAMDKESLFGGERQHFQLRLVNLNDCPALDSQQIETKKKLDEFYEKRRKVLVTYRSELSTD